MMVIIGIHFIALVNVQRVQQLRKLKKIFLRIKRVKRYTSQKEKKIRVTFLSEDYLILV